MKAARVHPLQPRADVGAVEICERDRMGVEPDVKLAEIRLIAADGRELVGWRQVLQEPNHVGRELGAAWPCALRIEGQQSMLVEPPEVSQREPTIIGAGRSGALLS